MKRSLSILMAVFILMQIFCISSMADDVNMFPPKRPSVGNMKVAVTEGSGSNNVAGLRTNGTLNIREELIQGLSYITEESKEKLLSLTNVVDVACTAYSVVALKNDGTVFVSVSRIKSDFGSVSTWRDIVAISAGTSHIVGLKSDGTVVTAGDNSHGQCDVMGWDNVSKIYAHYDTTLAIRKDGTVLATGVISNYSKLRKEENVKEIFCKKIYDNKCSFEVLRNDGTLSLTEQASIRDDGLIGYGGNDKTLSITEILSMLNYTGKIKSFKILGHGYSYSPKYLFLDEAGDFYLLQKGDDVHWSRKKLEEKIVDFTVDDKNYYAWDENGQIYSDALAFTSADWILTTNITYNGDKIFSDIPPYIKDGRTLAPIRAILESLGMTVSWDPVTRTATAIKGDIKITVTIDSDIAIVNGIQKTLDVPAEITNGRTFVPVRFFAEALNMNVDWDGYTKTVIIESK